MTTRTRRIARKISQVAIGFAVASLITTGTAIAFTHQSAPAAPAADVETLGRLVVTPNALTYVAPPPVIGRMTITRSHARFDPAA